MTELEEGNSYHFRGWSKDRKNGHFSLCRFVYCICGLAVTSLRSEHGSQQTERTMVRSNNKP